MSPRNLREWTVCGRNISGHHPLLCRLTLRRRLMAISIFIKVQTALMLSPPTFPLLLPPQTFAGRFTNWSPAFNGATAGYRFSDPAVPSFNIPEAAPNSPGEVLLTSGNEILTKIGEPTETLCNGDEAEYHGEDNIWYKKVGTKGVYEGLVTRFQIVCMWRQCYWWLLELCESCVRPLPNAIPCCGGGIQWQSLLFKENHFRRLASTLLHHIPLLTRGHKVKYISCIKLNIRSTSVATYRHAQYYTPRILIKKNSRRITAHISFLYPHMCCLFLLASLL